MTVVLEYNYGCIHVIRGESNEALCLPDIVYIVLFHLYLLGLVPLVINLMIVFISIGLNQEHNTSLQIQYLNQTICLGNDNYIHDVHVHVFEVLANMIKVTWF